MGAPKKATHIIVHPNFHLRVNGKLQHVPKGTEVALAAADAKRYGDKVIAIGEKKAVDITPSDDG